MWVLESLWEAPLLQRPGGEDPCARQVPPDHRGRWAGGVHGASARGGGLSGPGGRGRPGWRAQHCLCTSLRPRALPPAGLCLWGRRQGRLTPVCLWACAPSLAGRSSHTSHPTVLGTQVHLELLGHDHDGLQTETVPGSSLKAFLLPCPTLQGDLRQDQRALTFLIGRVVHAHRGDPRTCSG